MICTSLRSLKPPRIFGRGAAPILLQLLQHCSGLGITWGHTLASCVAALRDLRQHGQWPKTRKTVVFPLRGEPMWLDRRVGDSPSFLAAELQDLFVPGKQALSLSVVPAFTPLDLSRKSVQALLHNVVSYARIFGGGRAAGPGHPRPLIETAAILTGIGAVDEGLGAWTSEALKAAQVPLDRLRDIAIGDIAGVFLPKEGLDPDDRKELSAINANWWGLERQHLAAAAGRAGRGHHPGTIALALGGHAKARVLLAALREGLCSTLVVSDIIADALTDVLDRE
jgi:DNA-binding transcriptional regulator LsrR (DeoR family)